MEERPGAVQAAAGCRSDRACGPSAGAKLGLPRCRRVERERHAAAAEPAIAARIFREILLVIVLGVVERGRRRDLGGDLRDAARREQRLVPIAALLGLVELLVVEAVDRRAVLRADVGALAHALRRVVRGPER